MRWGGRQAMGMGCVPPATTSEREGERKEKREAASERASEKAVHILTASIVVYLPQAHGAVLGGRGSYVNVSNLGLNVRTCVNVLQNDTIAAGASHHQSHRDQHRQMATGRSREGTRSGSQVGRAGEEGHAISCSKIAASSQQPATTAGAACLSFELLALPCPARWRLPTALPRPVHGAVSRCITEAVESR